MPLRRIDIHVQRQPDVRVSRIRVLRHQHIQHILHSAGILLVIRLGHAAPRRDAVHGTLQRADDPGVVRRRVLAHDHHVSGGDDHLAPHLAELEGAEESEGPGRVGGLVPVPGEVGDV